MVERISKLLIRPPSCDLIIFGDLLIGEVWKQTEFVENKQEFLLIQWKPEPELLRELRNSTVGKRWIDKETGVTMTLSYPKSRCFYRIADKKWMVFMDCFGVDPIDYGLDKRLIEKNETLESENRQLRNEIGFLNSELEKTNTRIDEQIKSWARRLKIASSTREDDYDTGNMNESSPQAGFMGSNG